MNIHEKVVNLDGCRPHLSGHAGCFGCGHTWIAAVPVGTAEMECPRCGTMKGRMRNEVIRELAHWKCPCGCSLFSITPQGIYCPNCGAWHRPYDDTPRRA